MFGVLINWIRTTPAEENRLGVWIEGQYYTATLENSSSLKHSRQKFTNVMKSNTRLSMKWEEDNSQHQLRITPYNSTPPTSYAMHDPQITTKHIAEKRAFSTPCVSIKTWLLATRLNLIPNTAIQYMRQYSKQVSQPVRNPWHCLLRHDNIAPNIQ